MEKQFAGRPVRFVSVANDSQERVSKYLRDKSITVQSFVEGESEHGTFEAFGVTGIPAAAVVDPEGRLLAVTPGENITPELVSKLLAGEKLTFPKFDRINNITWDQDEITWQDGVLPIFQVVIKPLEVSGGGYTYRPGSNHVSGDGASLQTMIQVAWRTDSNHLVKRGELPAGTYRFAVTVPKGREAELFPSLQEALQRTFAVHAQWEEEERDVLVLTRTGERELTPSASEEMFQFVRGKITMRKQPMTKLAQSLPNWLGKTVVDETGLTGTYDFDLEYRDDGPKMLTDGLREKYGLVLSPGRRKVRVLVVELKP